MLVLVLAVPAVVRAEPGLDTVVRAVSHDVITAIRHERGAHAGEPAKLVDLGERMILPHVDAERMTRLAMGAIWALATPDQRQRLAREFATLLVRGYSAALASYTDQLMIVSRVRAEPRDSEVAVKFEINQPDARPMAIDYSLARTASGWRVYDIRIGGASLATVYGPAFSEEARNYGIEGLISLLSIRNQESARRAPPVLSVRASARCASVKT
jgi:phospholipid transport system substrate-binding protein